MNLSSRPKAGVSKKGDLADRGNRALGVWPKEAKPEAGSQVAGKSCITNRWREITRPFRTRITTDVTFHPAPLLARNS